MILAVDWLRMAPLHVPTYGLIALIAIAIMGLSWLMRLLAFWTLAGSPGEEIFAALKRGRLTAQ
jgi:hypothetical protein